MHLNELRPSIGSKKNAKELVEVLALVVVKLVAEVIRDKSHVLVVK